MSSLNTTHHLRAESTLNGITNSVSTVPVRVHGWTVSQSSNKRLRGFTIPQTPATPQKTAASQMKLASQLNVKKYIYQK